MDVVEWLRLTGDSALLEAASEIERLSGLVEEMKLRLPKGLCSIDGCDRPAKTKGWCQTHYMRWVRRGDPTVVAPPGKPGSKRKHPLYGAWAGMINRCSNPNNHRYADYGGRGIAVCERWRSDFCNFLADMGERPPGMSLDRINPYGPYSPENCRWATAKQQRGNRTAEGAQRTKTASSVAMKAYWDRWRAERAEPETGSS